MGRLITKPRPRLFGALLLTASFFASCSDGVLLQKIQEDVRMATDKTKPKLISTTPAAAKKIAESSNYEETGTSAKISQVELVFDEPISAEGISNTTVRVYPLPGSFDDPLPGQTVQVVGNKIIITLQKDGAGKSLDTSDSYWDINNVPTLAKWYVVEVAKDSIKDLTGNVMTNLLTDKALQYRFSSVRRPTIGGLSAVALTEDGTYGGLTDYELITSGTIRFTLTDVSAASQQANYYGELYFADITGTADILRKNIIETDNSLGQRSLGVLSEWLSGGAKIGIDCSIANPMQLQKGAVSLEDNKLYKVMIVPYNIDGDTFPSLLAAEKYNYFSFTYKTN